jgi:hypothetical protein
VRLIALLAAAGVAAASPPAKPGPASRATPAKLVLKAGQAIAFPASIAEGKVVLGPARLGKFGELQPADGEIAVGLSTRGKDLYESIVVVEKTTAPVDFLATGLIGEIKIDERDIHGRLGEPVTQRIGATSWTVWLNGFEVGK